MNKNGITEPRAIVEFKHYVKLFRPTNPFRQKISALTCSKTNGALSRRNNYYHIRSLDAHLILVRE